MSAKTNPRTVLDKAIRANLGGVHTAEVCKVLAYDLNEGVPVADVRPVNKRRTNLDEFVDAPILYGVPVPPLAWGDFVIHAPLNEGDHVLVSYAERSLDEWLANGGDEVEPRDSRRFSESDAVVLRKIDPLSQAPSSDAIQADALTLSKRDGSARVIINADGSVVVDSNTIKLGSSAASDAVALSSKVDQFFTFLDTLFVTGWIVVPADGGAALKAAYALARTALYPSGIGSVGASKVDAE